MAATLLGPLEAEAAGADEPPPQAARTMATVARTIARRFMFPLPPNLLEPQTGCQNCRRPNRRASRRRLSGSAARARRVPAEAGNGLARTREGWRQRPPPPSVFPGGRRAQLRPAGGGGGSPELATG